MISVIPELEKKCRELNCKDGAFSPNRDVVLMAVGSDRDDFSNKELFDYGMMLLNMVAGENRCFDKNSAFGCGMSKAQDIFGILIN